MSRDEIKLGRDTNHTLWRTMASYGMSRRWVAESLKVNLSTVDRWLQPDDGASFRAMPNSMVKLLGYAMQDPDRYPLYRNPPDPEGELRPRD